MAVTNTVQGMNDTISLLKQILDAVKTGGNNTVQPSDVSSTARTVNNNTDMGNAVNDINAIGRTNKNLVKNVNSFTTAIKSLTSKETLSGITKLAMLKMTGILNLFSAGVKILISALNQLEDLKINMKTINKFNKTLNGAISAIKVINNVVLSLGLMIMMMASLGFLVPLMIPQILYGFAAITSLVFVLLATIKLISLFTKLIKLDINIGAKLGKNESMYVPGVQEICGIILSLGFMIMMMATLGVLVPLMIPQILKGFGAILVAVAALSLLILAMNLITDTNAGQTIAYVVGSLLALSLFVIVAAGVGAMIINFWPQIWRGLLLVGGILVIMIGILALVALVGRIGSTKEHAMSLMLIVGTLLILTAVIGAIVLVNKAIDAGGGYGRIWHTLGMMAAIIGFMTLIILALAAIDKFMPGGVTVATITILAIAGVILLLSWAIDNIVDVGIKIAKANKDNVFEGIGKAGFKIGWAISTMVAGLIPAAALAIPISIAMVALNKIIGTISSFVDMISKFAVTDGSLVPIEIDKDGNVTKVKKKINIKKVASIITDSFVKFVTTLHTGFKNLENKQFRQMGRHAKNLNKMIKPISNFVDMISKFASKDGVITLIDDAEYNDDGSVSKLSNTKINMQTIAANISQAFITFANTLDNNLTALDIEGKTARSAKRLGMIMTPISSLLDVIKNYEFNDNTITYIDENGKKVTIDNYNKKIENLGKFISTLYSSLKIKDDSNENFFQKLGIGDGTNKLSNLLEAISASSSGIISLMTTTIPDEKQTVWYHFNNIKMSSDNKTPALQKQAELINEFGTAVKNIDDIIFKNDKRRIEAIKKYTEEITKLATQMSSLAESTKIVANNQIVKNNETPNTNKQNNQQFQVIQQQSAPVTQQNQQNNQSYSNFDYEDLKNAIIDAFSNKQIKVSFDDSLEDLIGDLSLV